MAKARIEKYNGSPAIMIDGKVYPPMLKDASGMVREDREKIIPIYKEFREAGIRIFNVAANTDWLKRGESARVCHEIEKFLEEMPDVYFMIRITLNPPVEWVENHPDDVLRYSDGSVKPIYIGYETGEVPLYPAMYSLCSQQWREDAAEALLAFVREVDKYPVSNRIIGYFLCASSTAEWYYNFLESPMDDWEQGIYADVSPSARKNFSRFLKKKYGTQEALRKAWKDENADIENPEIPGLERREYVDVADKLIRNMRNFDMAYAGMDTRLNPEYIYTKGLLADGNNNMQAVDFYEAWNVGTAESLVYVASVLKEYNSDRLVGSFYGCLAATKFHTFSTSALTTVLESGKIDLLMTPDAYEGREPGSYAAQRMVQDSIRLQNMIVVCEDDNRSHLNNPTYRAAYQTFTLEDTINTMKRDFGRNLCDDIYGYWSLLWQMQGQGPGPDLMKLISRQQDIARMAYELNRTKHNEIAMIYDQESIYYASQALSELVLWHSRISDWGKIGAPVDYYLHQDMEREDMPDYKLYIMLNTYVLTEEEVNVIYRKAAKNHAAILWLYADGFYNPDAEVRMDVAHVEKVTGFKIKQIDDTLSPAFRLTQKHPAVKYGSLSRKYGFIDRHVYCNCQIGVKRNKAPLANPLFYIDDPEAEILGRYLINDKDALGVKEYRGVTCFYCGTQVLRSDLMASIAEYVGCHLFLKTGKDVLCANESFVMVHACEDGVKKIHFKKPCSPYEVYEEKYYGQNITELEVEMGEGQTLMFCVADKK